MTDTTSRIAPGPRGRPIIGVLPEFQDDPLTLLEDLRAQYGDVVRVPLGELYLVSHPDGVKHVLQDNHLNYKKGFDYQRMEPLLGQGLLTSNGETWKRHRRLAQPAFHRQRIAGFGAVMVRRTHEALARWRALGDGAVIDVHAEMMRLTLEVVGDALFSSDLGTVTERVSHALEGALHYTNERIHNLIAFPMWVPTPFNLAYRRHVRVLDEVVGTLIRERRGQPARDDLLSMLMDARDEESGGTALDDAALRDEVMTLLLAGHETTANALTFTLRLLTLHPAVRDELERTVATALGGRDATADDAQALGYTRQLAEESMRLYPPAWSIAREAIDDDVVLGYRVPKGSLVMLAQWLVHRDERFWPEPERFDPARFAPDAPERHRFAWFPFGGGPRLCIGNSFSLLELQLILSTLAQHVRVEVLEPEKLELEPSITLRPRGGMRARLRWRTGAA